MNRTLKLSMLMALALGTTQAMALGLGQIRVKSALDRPLVAEIPLITDYPGEADNVQVSLASPQDFARAGLDRSRFPADLTFKVVTNAQGQKVIRVTSAKPVRETYLDFLVQVEWPRGRLLREFTVLLDPPNTAPATPAASAGGAARTAPSSPRAATTSPASSPAAPTGGAGSRISNGKYGPVRGGETLSEIATRAAPSGVSMNQMLVAMYQANRSAFYRNNMNALKRGAVLRIPTREQAEATSAAKASAEVRRQYEDWKGMAARSPTMVSSTGGSRAATTASAGGGGKDALKLVPPKKGGSSSGQPGVSGGTGQESVTGLKQDLARAQESLGNLKQESQDLKSRLGDLQKINDKNQRLLSLKNAEIAELQQKLAEARKAAGMAPAAAGSVVKSAAGAPAAASTAGTMPAMAASATKPATTGSVAKAPAAAATAAKASTPAPAKPVTKPAPKPVTTHKAPARPAPVGQPWYMQLWAWIGGGAVAVLLLVWLLLRGRKPAAPAAPRPSLADQFGDTPLPEGNDDDDRDALLEELAEHPDDVGLHLELVSLYYARRDVDHFEAAAEAMYAHVSDPDQAEWQEVRAMGEELAPEHPLFGAAESATEGTDEAAPAVAEDEESAPGFDAPEAFDVDSFMADHGDEGGDILPELDEGLPADAAPEAADAGDESAASEGGSQGYSFDFDLTPRREPAAEGEDEAAAAPTEEEFDALPPLPEEGDEGLPVDLGDEAPATADGGSFDEAEPLSEDPVDTKLDLARAYLDMGDPDGARAMLEEVLAEGSQMQRDTAQKLLDEIG